MGCENVGEKGDVVAKKDRSVSSSCVQLLKSMKWRDRRSDEGKARDDGDSQREKAKWQGYHGSVAALLRNSRGDAIAKKSRCANGVAMAECEAPCRRSGDRWLTGRCGETQGWTDIEVTMQLGSTTTKRIVVRRDGEVRP